MDASLARGNERRTTRAPQSWLFQVGALPLHGPLFAVSAPQPPAPIRSRAHKRRNVGGPVAPDMEERSNRELYPRRTPRAPELSKMCPKVFESLLRKPRVGPDSGKAGPTWAQSDNIWPSVAWAILCRDTVLMHKPHVPPVSAETLSKPKRTTVYVPASLKMAVWHERPQARCC